MPEDEGPWSARRPPVAPRRSRRALRIAIVLIVGAGVLVLLRLFPGRISTPTDWAFLFRGLALLVLVSSGLFSATRQTLKQTARNIAIWAAIAGVVVLGVTYQAEIGAVGQRVRSALVPSYAVSTATHQIALTQDIDGDFHVVGQVNGQPVTFLVDTGSSDMVLSPADAQRLGVDLKALDFNRAYETANGVGRGAPFNASSLTVGAIKLSNVPMSINQAPMATSLLGMSFLKRLDSFEVKGDQLILNWRS
jgi:aspartyl protease family protein